MGTLLFIISTTKTPHNTQTTKKPNSYAHPTPLKTYVCHIATRIKATLKVNMQRKARETLHVMSLPLRGGGEKNISNTLYRITKNLPEENNKCFNFKVFRQAKGPYFVPNSSEMLSIFQPD